VYGCTVSEFSVLFGAVVIRDGIHVRGQNCSDLRSWEEFRTVHILVRTGTDGYPSISNIRGVLPSVPSQKIKAELRIQKRKI
jgi:hypothetical protein